MERGSEIENLEETTSLERQVADLRAQLTTVNARIERMTGAIKDHQIKSATSLQMIDTAKREAKEEWARERTELERLWEQNLEDMEDRALQRTQAIEKQHAENLAKLDEDRDILQAEISRLEQNVLKMARQNLKQNEQREEEWKEERIKLEKTIVDLQHQLSDQECALEEILQKQAEAAIQSQNEQARLQKAIPNLEQEARETKETLEQLLRGLQAQREVPMPNPAKV